MPKKIRLDELVVLKGFAPTKTKAQALIMSGDIWVDQAPSLKPGKEVAQDATIEHRPSKSPYVSRGGEKLEGALRHFKIDVSGMLCLDVGASTGGFTDCLLRHGARKVFTIDVGKGQLDPKIRHHPQVSARESFHANLLTPSLFEAPLDLITVDVSFISLKKTLPSVVPCLKKSGLLLALIKPQFEATAKDLRKGVLKDEALRLSIVQTMVKFVQESLLMHVEGTVDSGLKGPKGNQETFLLSLKP